MKTQQRLRRMSAAVLIGLTLLGCTNPQPQDLSFQTITEGLGGVIYSQEESEFRVIATANDVESVELEIQFSPELAEQLRQLDYQRNFAIVVLRGPGVARTVNILQIVRTGDDVIVKTHFAIPEPGSIVHAGLDASPYQIVAVPKGENWAREIHFVLEVDGQVVKEHVYFVQ